MDEDSFDDLTQASGGTGSHPGPWPEGKRAAAASSSSGSAGSDDGDGDGDSNMCTVCDASTDDSAGCVLICDGCEGEVHLACSGLSRVPRGDWYCHACPQPHKKRNPSAGGAAGLKGREEEEEEQQEEEEEEEQQQQEGEGDGGEGDYTCEHCGGVHDGSYGSGRFCGRSCRSRKSVVKRRNAARPIVIDDDEKVVALPVHASSHKSAVARPSKVLKVSQKASAAAPIARAATAASRASKAPKRKATPDLDATESDEPGSGERGSDGGDGGSGGDDDDTDTDVVPDDSDDSDEDAAPPRRGRPPGKPMSRGRGKTSPAAAGGGGRGVGPKGGKGRGRGKGRGDGKARGRTRYASSAGKKKMQGKRQKKARGSGSDDGSDAESSASGEDASSSSSSSSSEEEAAARRRRLGKGNGVRRNWCDVCRGGPDKERGGEGSLVDCSGCARRFHRECTPMAEALTGGPEALAVWRCPLCVNDEAEWAAEKAAMAAEGGEAAGRGGGAAASGAKAARKAAAAERVAGEARLAAVRAAHRRIRAATATFLWRERASIGPFVPPPLFAKLTATADKRPPGSSGSSSGSGGGGAIGGVRERRRPGAAGGSRGGGRGGRGSGKPQGWKSRWSSKGVSSSSAAAAAPAPCAATLEGGPLTVDVSGASPIKATLRDYQERGVNWLLRQYHRGSGGILGDEMGLGKTLQCLSFLSTLHGAGLPGPHLVVAPLAVVQNWVNEVKRFVPHLTHCKVQGSRNERWRVLSSPDVAAGKVDVYVTTYETVLAEEAFFTEQVWGRGEQGEIKITRRRCSYSFCCTFVHPAPTPHRAGLCTGS